MKKFFVYILPLFVFFAAPFTSVAEATASEEAYANTVMNRLEEIVMERTSTQSAADSLWETIADTISAAISEKEDSNQDVHPVLYVLERKLDDRVFLNSVLSNEDSSDVPVPSFSDSPSEYQAYAQQMLAQVNAERKQRWIEELSFSDTLNKIAQDHAEYMVINDHFSHVTRDGVGPDIRAERAWYDYQFIGENIAFGQTSVSQVMREWMDSFDHRVNILDEDYTEFWFGFYQDHWVQVFGNEINKE